jgi:hypothetical protein
VIEHTERKRMARPLGSAVPPRHFRIGASTGGGLGNTAELAHAGKAVDIVSLDRPVWTDEQDGDQAAVVVVNVQLSGHHPSPSAVGFIFSELGLTRSEHTLELLKTRGSLHERAAGWEP